jgi:hypothetical protein
MWISFPLTVDAGPGDNLCGMGRTRISGMLAAADHLCWAADDLRTAGFLTFAAEIDSLLRLLDAKIAVADHLPFPRRPTERVRTSSRCVIRPCRRPRHRKRLL